MTIGGQFYFTIYIKVHNLAGERKRKYEHYLKGTVYCSECGSRMSLTIAKDKYQYFYCLGQTRHNGCKQRYTSDVELEKMVEEFYKTIQLPREWSDKLIAEAREELVERELLLTKEREFQAKRVTKLVEKRQRLLDAYLNKAIPIELLKKEQDKIADDLLKAEVRLEEITEVNNAIDENIILAISLASNCYEAYKKGSPKTRRLFNQAFLNKAYLKNGIVSGSEFAKPFDVILSPGSSKNHLVGPVGFEPTTNGL